MRLLAGLAVLWAIAIVAVTMLLVTGEPSTTRSQLIASASVLLAILFCLVTCVRAARKPTRARLGWTLMAVGMALGALGQAGWVAVALSSTQSAPSALGDTLAFLGYFLPTVAAIFAFPRRSELRISRYRQLLDVLVITIGVLLISEATVLGTVLRLTDITTLAGLLHLAYLVADVAICALVLCIGMRQLPGDRLTWLFLGSGLLVVAISDSVYVEQLAQGAEYVTATPLAAGWMLGPVLIGLATFMPMTGRVARGRDYTVLLQLLPYLPGLGALVVLILAAGIRDPYLLVTAGLLLLVIMIRQSMIVYENVSLTRDLEGKVARRTRELAVLGSIVTSSTDAIVGVSRDGVITAWNPAAERLYGHRAADVSGNAPDFLLSITGTSTQELLERADGQEELPAYEIDWSRPDGTVVPVAMTISPIVGRDGVQGISIFAQDITGRRREAEALEQARENALTSSRLKSEFLATMSHEIRTPMNAVIGLTSLLLETELNPTQRMYAEGVQSAGDALLTVIDDILDFSKLEAGKVVLDQSDFSPRQLVEGVGALMAPAASAKGIELIAYCLPEVPAAVHGDVGRIRQILLNLASNAVKFTAQGEVIIKAAALSADRDRTRLRFEVIDTGIGITEKDQARLFQSFSQADASTTRRFGGTGLGLAISRRLVEVMGGTIHLESEVDVGSTFSVELPLRTAAKAKPALDLCSQELLADLRVLVVDDNATNRTLLKSQLEIWRMRSDVAEGASEAFEKLRSAALQGRPYDVLTLDAYMPIIDGLALARRVSADPVLGGTSMIMLTSGLHPEPEVMREVGIDQWLPKPVRSAELLDRLLRLIAPKEDALRARRSYAESRQPGARGEGTVLVVDHDATSRVVAQRLVADLGFDVHCVATGSESVDAVRTTNYTAIMIDIDLRTIDGFETARAISQLHDPDRGAPLVAMITHPTTQDGERCSAAGIQQILYRPLDSIAVEAALMDLPRPNADGGAGSARPVAEPEPGERLLDLSRLKDLEELTSPDGSNLMVSMVDSYVRRSFERAEALVRAAISADLETISAIAHELRGASGTIGAHRVMQRAGAIEHEAREGREPRAESIADLVTEIDLAVGELTAYAGQRGPETSQLTNVDHR